MRFMGGTPMLRIGRDMELAARRKKRGKETPSLAVQSCAKVDSGAERFPMRKCPVCEFRNLDERERCLKCGATLAPDAVFRPPKVSRHAALFDRFYAWRRGIVSASERVGRMLAVPLPPDVSYRFPLAAAFLGLAPGLGQIYNRQPKKIVFFLPPFLLFFTLAVRHITTAYVGNACIAAAIGVQMLSFSDALLSAARINGQTFTLRNRLAALTYPVFLLGAIGFIFGVLSFLGLPLFSLFHVNGDYMAPALVRGDRVCGEKMSHWLRGPEPGDVVRYDPPGYGGMIGSTYYLINPTNGWERILAREGETLEWRGGKYYVDGRPLAREYYPLLTSEMPPEFEIECPPGHYIILITWRADDKGLITQLRQSAGAQGGVTHAPALTERLMFERWKEACCPEQDAILDRAWFIYQPAPRRRFFQPRGPRFEP